MILEHLDLSTPKELIHEIYYRDVHRHTIAGIAGLVQRAMDEHDAIAAEILTRAGAELDIGGGSVIDRLEMRGDAFPTVLAGGIFRGIPWLVDDVTAAAVGDCAAHARPACSTSSRRSARCALRLLPRVARLPCRFMCKVRLKADPSDVLTGF